MPAGWSQELELVDWRRAMAGIYAAVRAEGDPARAHRLWREGRDGLLRTHPQSPLPPGDPLRATGVAYWPYDPALRFELPVRSPGHEARRAVPTDGGATTSLRLVGQVELPAPIGAVVGLWWLEQYAGGLFMPLRDATAGHASYGGGRYLLDTAKGADLGGTFEGLVIDLNFLYHPSCRYDARWECPLASRESTIDVAVMAGERLGAAPDEERT